MKCEQYFNELGRNTTCDGHFGNTSKDEQCKNTETLINIYRKREELVLRNYMESL